MKREIKFRGLRTNGKGFVYGSFIHNSIDCPCIVDYDAEQYEIIPKTVGQFTGLKDKNGVDIYDKDKLRITFGNGSIAERTLSIGDTLGIFIDDIHEFNNLNILEMVVIGNIHEN